MESRWLGTARGRLGIAFGSWLPYATGGVAVGRVSYSDFGFFPFLPSSNTSSITQTRLAGPREEGSNGNSTNAGASRPSICMWI